MNCCSDYGECKQGFGCPARCTPVIPKPADCIKARHCLSDTEHCSCDANDQPMQPLDTFDHLCIWSVLICFTVAFCFGVSWLVGLVANSAAFAAAQDWISSAAQALVSALPMTPFF